NRFPRKRPPHFTNIANRRFAKPEYRFWNPRFSSQLKRIVLILLLFAPAVYASLDSVRQNFANYYSAAGADRDAARMRNALAALETSSLAYSSPGYLLIVGSLRDI